MKIEKHFAKLASNGYCETSQNFLHYLKNHPDVRQNFLRFRSGTGLGAGVKYSCVDLFGKRQFVYYVLNCEDARKKFSEHLVRLFEEKNPNPDSRIKGAFTKLLHDHNLHSKYCCEVLYGRSASVSSLQIFD